MMGTLLFINNGILFGGVAVLATENKNYIESFEKKTSKQESLLTIFGSGSYQARTRILHNFPPNLKKTFILGCYFG